MWDFSWVLRRNEDGLMNYFRMPFDNGAVEGISNKTKVVSHKAYGFQTAKSLTRNLYQCMAHLPLPKTVHRFA